MLNVIKMNKRGQEDTGSTIMRIILWVVFTIAAMAGLIYVLMRLTS